MTGMQQIQVLARRAREAGMSYGKYVALHADIMPRPQDMGEHRICKECGELFLPPLKKDGTRSERRRKCDACVEKKRKTPRISVYRLICQECGREMEAATPRKKFCAECAKERNRRAARKWSSGYFC